MEIEPVAIVPVGKIITKTLEKQAAAKEVPYANSSEIIQNNLDSLANQNAVLVNDFKIKSMEDALRVLGYLDKMPICDINTPKTRPLSRQLDNIEVIKTSR